MDEPEEKFIPADASYASIAPGLKKRTKGNNGILIAALGAIGLLTLAGFRKRKKDF